MSEHHTFGVPGASRRVLDQCHFIGTGCFGHTSLTSIASFRCQIFYRHNAAKRRNSRLEQPCQLFGLAEGNQKTSFSVLQNPGLPLRVLFKPAGFERRVNRDWHANGRQNPKKREEEVFARGKHQRNGISPTQPACRQATRNGGRASHQTTIADDLRSTLLAVKVNVRPGWSALCIEFQQRVERSAASRLEERHSFCSEARGRWVI